MPTVVNGIGTWHYGKRRIHRRRGTCPFCHRLADLESYDTTNYFVVAFVPLLPLGSKRVLEACPACQRFRVTPLKKWEQAKARDVAAVLSQLEENPDDRETTLKALGLATTYQDEPLFNKLAAGLAGHRPDDADLQRQLAAGYAYFGRWDQAEAAYRAALVAREDPEVRDQLAVVLLKQGRPDAAREYLRDILPSRNQDRIGLIQLLIEGYQAEGRHQDALDLMAQRDAAFPELASLKEFIKQRKLSEKNLDSGKPIRSTALGDPSRAGSSEGGPGARLARFVGPAVAVALLAWYFGAAVWISHNRTVHLVSGSPKPYAVAVNGVEHQLAPGAELAVAVPEGEVTLEFPGRPLPIAPETVEVSSPFFSRPFARHTFVVNPDRLAVVVWEQRIYSSQPGAAPPAAAPRPNMGRALYSFEGIDYEFEDFPQQIRGKGSVLTRSRVSALPPLSPEVRLTAARGLLQPNAHVDTVKRSLLFDPDDSFTFEWLLGHSTPNDALAFVTAGLDVRPPLVLWHRAYQDLTEKTNPGDDLTPRYRKLVEECPGNGDALYLLARVAQDADEADQTLRRAAAAQPPSAYALYAVGYRAVEQGEFDEAVRWMDKAVAVAPSNFMLRKGRCIGLFAAGHYKAIREELHADEQSAESRTTALMDEVRFYAAIGDAAAARAVAGRVGELVPDSERDRARRTLDAIIDTTLCCARRDVGGFLRAAARLPDPPRFHVALLQGKLADASAALGNDRDQAIAGHALLYLAAGKAGDTNRAESELKALTAELAKGRRYQRQLADVLAGRKPPDVSALRRLPVDPGQKAVLLAAVARRHPESAKELLPLARKFDFNADATSLCLRHLLGDANPPV